MLQQPGETTDDGQPEAHTVSGTVSRRACPVELVENAIAIDCRDADSTIDDINADLGVAASQPHYDAAIFGVVQRVADKVGEDALEQDRVAVDPHPRVNHRESQATTCREGCELSFDAREQGRQREWCPHRRNRARIELGNVHERREKPLQRFHRQVDATDDVARLRLADLC